MTNKAKIMSDYLWQMDYYQRRLQHHQAGRLAMEDALDCMERVGVEPRSVSASHMEVVSATPDESWTKLERVMGTRDLKVQKSMRSSYNATQPTWEFRLYFHPDFYVTFYPAEPDPDCRLVVEEWTGEKEYRWRCEKHLG